MKRILRWVALVAIIGDQAVGGGAPTANDAVKRWNDGIDTGNAGLRDSALCRQHLIISTLGERMLRENERMLMNLANQSLSFLLDYSQLRYETYQVDTKGRGAMVRVTGKIGQRTTWTGNNWRWVDFSSHMARFLTSNQALVLKDKAGGYCFVTFMPMKR